MALIFEAAFYSDFKQFWRNRLAIFSLALPGMGSRKAMEGILAINPRVKIMIASGYSADGQVKASLESGFAAYLAKPFLLVDLLTSIRSVPDKK